MSEEKVLVFKRALLEQTGYFNGFSPELDKYLRMFEDPNSYFFMDRAMAEKDPTYKQVIPYSIMRHQDRILFYQRSKQGDSRLQEKASIGVGGHINPQDAVASSDLMEILLHALKREVLEEFHVPEILNINHIGLINDDSDEVGSVHFGIVSFIGLAHERVSVRNAEIKCCDFLTTEEIEFRSGTLESWSRICLDRIDWRG